MAGGNDNLIPFDQLPEEQQREIRRKGALASAAAKRRKKMVRDVASEVLSLTAPISPTARKDLAERWGISVEDVDVLFVSIASIASKAMKGDTKAFEVLRDSAGEKPTDNMKLTHDIADGAVIRYGYEDDD